MTNAPRWLLIVFFVSFSTSVAGTDEPASPKPEASRLRFFDTGIFGAAVDKPVLLLRPACSGQLDPETIMVDIDKGRYFAAAVRYPKKISLAEARRSLNTVYAKHEIKRFADDPAMGLWRNEDDQFSIQLTEDEDNLVVIYIKYPLLTEKKISESFSRAFKAIENDADQRP